MSTVEMMHTETARLVAAVKTIVDRHAETKEGSGLLYMPVLPREMKELRSALEPFRKLPQRAQP